MSPIIKEYRLTNMFGESYGDLATVLKQLRNVTEQDINVELGEINLRGNNARIQYTVDFSAELKEALPILMNWLKKYKQLLIDSQFSESVINDRIGNVMHELQVYLKMSEATGRTDLLSYWNESENYYSEDDDFIYEFGKEMRGVPKEKQPEKAKRILADKNFQLEEKQKLLQKVIKRNVNNLNRWIAEVVGQNLDFITFNTIKTLNFENDPDVISVKEKIKNSTDGEIAKLYLKVLDTMEYQKAEKFPAIAENREAFNFFLERKFFEYPKNSTITET